MSRREELLQIFAGSDENVCKIVGPMIDELVFIEDQLVELKKQPFIRYHPKDPSIQKATPAGKLYKELLASHKDMIRILCSQLHKTGEVDGDSPLRQYLKSLER